MALYVPEGRRRRRLLVTAAVSLVIGLGSGGLIGRLSAPSVTSQVHQVQSDAHDTAAGLRVIALHDQNLTGSGGTALVLARTKTELRDEFEKAPWLSQRTRSALLAQLAQLDARTDTGTPAFGDAAEALAQAIDVAFTG